MTVNIIPPRVDFIDPRTQKIAREWYLFLLNNVTRLDASDIEMLGLQVAPVSQPQESTSQETLLASLVARYDTLISAIEASYLTPPQVLGDASVSSLTASKTIQVTGNATPSTGKGVELLYDSSGNGAVLSYDRVALAYRPLLLNGLTVSMQPKGADAVVATNSGGTDVNFVSISSNVTTAGPVITAAGETNVALHLRSKGTGAVVIGSDGYPIANFAAGTAANFLVFSNAANDPGITTASAGAIKIPTMLQITNYAAPTAGAGLELGYDTAAPAAFVQAYDRAGAAWKNIGLAGYGVGITLNGGLLTINSPGAFTAGAKYLVIAADGTVRVSALGPAS